MKLKSVTENKKSKKNNITTLVGINMGIGASSTNDASKNSIDDNEEEEEIIDERYWEENDIEGMLLKYIYAC